LTIKCWLSILFWKNKQTKIFWKTDLWLYHGNVRIESANLLDLNYINLTNRYYNLIYEDIGFITQSLYRERHKVYPVSRTQIYMYLVRWPEVTVLPTAQHGELEVGFWAEYFLKLCVWKYNTTSMQSLKSYVHVDGKNTVYKWIFTRNGVNFVSFSI
jgi:hypothetical protein